MRVFVTTPLAAIPIIDMYTAVHLYISKCSVSNVYSILYVQCEEQQPIAA